LAWALAVIAAGITLFCAWTIFDTPRKENYALRWHRGNSGHAAIDFGGQWLMGRMVALGLGRHLYDRKYLREVVREAFPREDEIPPEERPADERDVHDAENMMGWLMGRDDPEAALAIVSFLAPLAGHDAAGAIGFTGAQQDHIEERTRQATNPEVGGALYPPIHALLMYPLGVLRPAQAYRITQVLGILLALVAGGGICHLSEGRIWWPMGVALVVLFPGFATSMNLGQNSILMLTLLIWGWVFLAHGRPVSGGILWGLMAFKPVWAAAFFLVPLLSRRWHFCVAMLLTSLGLIAVTLPLVGWQSWSDWIQVGHYASEIYATNRNWIFLSRDLIGIPRRWLLEFHDDYALQESVTATVLGWGMLLAVVACTAALSITRKEQSRELTGPPAAFLLLGAWMSCYHFMYYDVLLTALPVALLVTELRQYLTPVLVAVATLPDETRKNPFAQYFRPSWDWTPPRSSGLLQVGYRYVFVRNSMTLTLIALLAISDLLLTFLGIEISISATALKHSPIPLPITYSTAFAGTPWPTFCLFALWLWCGFKVNGKR
jgi:hypothetical protein